MTLKDNRQDSEWRCMYKGSFCPHMRSFKVDGSLHKLCDLHREMAIRNQRKWQQRQRERRLQSPMLPDEPLPSIDDDEWLAIAAELLENMSAEEILHAIHSPH